MATTKSKASSRQQQSQTDAATSVVKAKSTDLISISRSKTNAAYWSIALLTVTLLAFATRFYRINHPDEVVFDEVHFGKFASYYLQRTYFFDVHPPFAKLALAAAGWLIGYRGHFTFNEIGDSYIRNKVPYVGLRAFPASLGALTIPIVFLTMKESGYGLPATLIATSLVLFDNAHIGEDRLILLDSMLVFAMACAIYSYVKFYRQRRQPFSYNWWKWLLLTGVALSCVMSTKYVGLFSYVTIGLAVAIDLWDILDIERGIPMITVVRHVVARLVGLIVIPFILYLFWFYVHFSVLTKSGPGDEFMSPEFQETLSDNPMLLEARPVNFYDTITLVHKETRAYLHSHPDQYPLRYEDGRVSSQGQQVTGYPHNDTNNHWIIYPADSTPDNRVLGRRVRNNDQIKLYHVNTNTVLLTHDVASPLYATNQEFTTVSPDLAAGDRSADATFAIRLQTGKPDEEFKTKAGLFTLQHVPTMVMMMSDSPPLPEWGFKQQEINGNKKVADSRNTWYAESIIGLDDPARLQTIPRETKKMPFISKWLHLQQLMFYHNNKLTSSHPYASQPIEWPFLMRGVSFWTHDEDRSQIYLIGNPVGWWLSIALIAILVGVFSADQLMTRRGQQAISPATRKRLYDSTGFFLLAWAAHYFPFYLMGRQLFLHHYLPSHLASSLVAGAVCQFIFGRIGRRERGVISTLRDGGKSTSASTPVERDENSMLAWTAAFAIISAIVGGFLIFSPVTYGTPGLTIEQANKLKWNSNWDMHYLK